MGCLRAGEFENGTERIRLKVASLGQKYQRIRTTRPDGNCFYRGLMFGLCEWMMTLASDEEVERLFNLFKGSKDALIASGFDDIVTDFYDIVMNTMRPIHARTLTHDQLVINFRDPAVTEYFVYYLRYLTSMYIRQNSFLYEDFIVAMGFASLDDFIRSEVDAIGRDADNLQMVALLSYLHVGVSVAYLDQSETPDGTIGTIQIPDDLPPVVHLLYRPGHYDVRACARATGLCR